MAPSGSAPYTTFNFAVQLTIANASSLGLSSQLCDSEFSEVDGLEMTMEPRTLRVGGDNTRQVHLVGPVTYGNLTLKRGMTSSLDLWKWFSAATSGVARGTKAEAQVVMRDAANTPTIRFRLFDCLPLKLKAPALNAKDGILAIEEMQIAYGSFTVELA